MKLKFKIVLILVLNFSLTYAQPLAERWDYIEGSFFDSEKLTKDDKELFIIGWSNSADNTNNTCQLYPLKQYEYLHLEEKNERNKKFILRSKGFKFKESEMDSSVHYVYFLYNYEIMKIKVIKNLAGIRVKFREMKFQKGEFEIDFKKIAKKYKYKNKKIPKNIYKIQIELDTFPFEVGVK